MTNDSILSVKELLRVMRHVSIAAADEAHITDAQLRAYIKYVVSYLEKFKQEAPNGD